MQISKAELWVGLFLGAIALGAASAYAAHGVVAGALTAPELREHRQLEAVLFASTMFFLMTALMSGIFWILPTVRRQSREQGKLQSLTSLLRQRSQDFERAALTDALTGMNNRRFFDEALRQYLLEFARIGRPLGLMLIDLDHFKAINDTHGHDMGDQVLKAVAACLFECTRYHDIVARVGGEEFAVVTPNVDPSELRQFAERIRERISRLLIESGNVRIQVTGSIGIAVSEAGDESGAFVKRADVALYQAKQTGRNLVCDASGSVIPFGPEPMRSYSVSS